MNRNRPVFYSAESANAAEQTTTAKKAQLLSRGCRLPCDVWIGPQTLFENTYDRLLVISSTLLLLNPLIATLIPQSNGPPYSNTMIGTLAVDWWAVTFGTARRELGRAAARPGPSSLYQM